jgi:hypothetical protein
MWLVPTPQARCDVNRQLRPRGYNTKCWYHVSQGPKPALFSRKPKLSGYMAHTYNPNYSGGRDQEDHGLRPAQVKS